MYRNAYRVQLDLITLAATKANIMISLNGVIASVLLVSGSVLYANHPQFVLPLVIFMIASALSIYFAFASASPKAPERRKKLRSCLVQLLLGRISLKQFNEFRALPKKRFDRENSNILIFEDYANVPKQIYMDCMDELIHSPDKLYQKMSDQLYYLGKVADQKFTLLRYSYSSFRWGLILTVLSFLLIKANLYYFSDVDHLSGSFAAHAQEYKFDDIYEASGVQALPDGRLIVIEDEAEDALHVMTPTEDNRLIEDVKLTRKLMRAFYTPLSDLEAITLGPDGYIYAMTSFSHNKHGDRLAQREQFIRFKIVGDRVVDAYSYSNLRSVIEQSGILGKVDEQGKGGIVDINIEALSFNAQGQLMVGFRTPMAADKTIIGLLMNPTDIFEHRAKPVLSPQPILIDLHGGGIRAMSYNPRFDGYLISNEITGLGEHAKKHSQLLFWDGDVKHGVYHLLQTGLDNIEGITDVQVNQHHRLLLVSDNGRKNKNRSASYLVLEYGDLH